MLTQSGRTRQSELAGSKAEGKIKGAVSGSIVLPLALVLAFRHNAFRSSRSLTFGRKAIIGEAGGQGFRHGGCLKETCLPIAGKAHQSWDGSADSGETDVDLAVSLPIDGPRHSAGMVGEQGVERYSGSAENGTEGSTLVSGPEERTGGKEECGKSIVDNGVEVRGRAASAGEERRRTHSCAARTWRQNPQR